VLLVISRDSLAAVKNILDDFALISGLECNYEKTCILPMNPVSEEENRIINESGFAEVSSIKLLGANITANVSDNYKNFDGVINKIKYQIAFWSRFRLTLPGRIAIAKTYMTSQINYLGCVFRPTGEQIKTMQNLINNFIRKNLQISDERIYAAPERGGLGFFNISDFLEAQMSTWILRAKKMPIDNWRYDAHLLAPGNDPLLLRTSDVCNETHPILYDIVSSYNRFYYEFCNHKFNFLNSILFENPLFRDPENNNTLDVAFFGNNYYNERKLIIRRLSVSDCFLNKSFRNLEQFENIGLSLTMVRWLRLRNTIMRVYTVNQMAVWDHPNLTGIHKFADQWKKGSKKLRKYFEDVTDPLNNRSFIKFVE
jgi:hypothetical protein